MTSLHAVVHGAAGGSTYSFGFYDGYGGWGGDTSGDITVAPGDTLTLVVGAKATDVDDFDGPAGSAGYGGGGAGGTSEANYDYPAGGGGGSFLVDDGGTLLLAAGGGGGAANYSNGGDGGGATTGGTAGVDGGGGTTGGGGATTSAHGAAGSENGTAGSGSFVSATTLPTGGVGGAGWHPGGGGGGGYRAGGGGGGHRSTGNQSGSGGGGGAGYAAESVTNVTSHTGTRAGNGLIVLTWDLIGQPIDFEALTGPATVGTTQDFSATGGDSGNPIVYSINGATTGSACSLLPDGSGVSFDHPGSCVVDADQAGTTTYGAGHAQQTVEVVGIPTATTAAVSATTITATVEPANDGIDPTGTVTFTVDGSPVGQADLAAGATDPVATLDYTVPTGSSHQVVASYAGDQYYAPSQGSVTRSDPALQVSASASAPKRRGWWRKPVTISFRCTPTSGALIGTCPGQVVVGTQGKGKIVSRTVTADDGGASTARVTVNLDLTKPTVRIKGVKAGRTYHGSLPKRTCVVRDALSGPATCSMTTKKRSGHRVILTAKGFDKAGNRKKTKVTVFLLKR
ncbi:Ig-like domain-containing protein [Nocardioides sp. YIM 152588]|uniref:Ig-like domain-containing protein n=1 Tax=Nocardioides sp. YIM 152588 TaxID=3158259 RepID=UPI0032E4F9C0